MKWILLHKNSDNSAIYINMDTIVSVVLSGSNGTLNYANGTSLAVKETPTQIFEALKIPVLATI